MEKGDSITNLKKKKPEVISLLTLTMIYAWFQTWQILVEP